MINNQDTAENFFYFLFVIVPFSIAPLGYLIHRLNKSIKNLRARFASSPDYSSKKFIRQLLLRQFCIFFILVVICTIAVVSFAYKTHIILKFIFLVAVLPAFMVVLSLIAGLGKAFEAGFNSSTLLSTLEDLSKESRPNQKMKADEE